MNQAQWDKSARNLLLSADGRAALKRIGGIDVEIAKDAEQAEKPTVAILCPTYRAPEPQMTDSLSAMVRYTREKGEAIVYAGAPVCASVVHWSRNWLLSEQLKSGKPWTHVLFIDDDMVVTPDSLEKLLSHGKDIVGGLCTKRTDPPIPNIRFYDKDSGETRQIWEWPEDSLVEVDAVGTGLLLLSRHALEQVAQAYFDCLYEKEFYGLAGEKLENIKAERVRAFDEDKICYWFRFLPTPRHNIEMGEDISFCFMAQRYCGLKIYADTSVQPGHIGQYPFSIRDFLPYREHCIETAKREGRYKAQPLLSSELQVVG
ncbi:MAG TPA: hypothetical protein VN517_16215 [Terriglobales bacterium]|nr:hypothetical protein [Terriglobales bacterium]